MPDKPFLLSTVIVLAIEQKSIILLFMKNSPLTAKQAAILRYLQQYQEADGYFPSIREMQAAFGYKSTNSVIGHLNGLERKGYLERRGGYARAYRIRNPENPEPEDALHVVNIPVLGDIAAGYPDRVEAGGEIGRLQVDTMTANFGRPGKTFAIRVRGDSMINAGIHEGDTVVVEGREPRDGEIVAALIDGETTLKRFIRNDPHTPYLKAENPRYPELYPVEELVIQGVATAVVRKL